MKKISFLDLLNVLSDSADSHPYCFILGSGASLSSGIPTGAMLVKKWLQDIYYQEKGINTDDEKIIAEYIIEKEIVNQDFLWNTCGAFYSTIFRRRFPIDTDPSLGKNALRKIMSGKNPSFGYSALAKILTYSNHRIVLTTNFDHLIEDSLQKYAHTTPQIIVSKEQAKYALIKNDIGPPVILKLHGDNFFETKNLDSEISLMDKEWLETLENLFQKYTPIIIGYGGHDPGFTEALAKLKPKLCPHPPIWCYYHRDIPPSNSNINKFLNSQDGLVVNSPDFDETMLLFSNSFKVDQLENKHRKNQENNKAAWRREFEHLCDRIFDDSKGNNTYFSNDPDLYKNHILNSIEQVIGKDSSERDWWQWQYLARIKEDVSIFEKGKKMVSVPEALEASHIRFLFDRKKLSDNDASQRIERLYDTAKRKYNDDHPDTLSIRVQLARIIADSKPNEAKNHYHEILLKRRRILGYNHPDTIASLRNLSRFYLQQKNLDEALSNLQEAIIIHKDIYGETHWLTIQLQQNYDEIKIFKAKFKYKWKFNCNDSSTPFFSMVGLF